MEQPMVTMANVAYTWPGGTRTLGPLSATIASGHFVGLIGPNGAGKSTLLKLIAAFWALDAGQILVDGESVSRLSAPERAKLIAFVPQTLDTQFDLTVKEVIELGGINRRSWRDRWAFQGALLAERLDALLATTELTELKERPFNTLSGGEAKRTLLAAALAQEAPVLLLDEPTAHLDPGHALKFLNLVRHMVDTQKTTVLMAYHDLATVGLYVDTLWVMDQSQLVLQGPPDEVLKNPAIQQIYDARLLEISHPRAGRSMLIFP